jgi:hypothetical protein
VEYWFIARSEYALVEGEFLMLITYSVSAYILIFPPLNRIVMTKLM